MKKDLKTVFKEQHMGDQVKLSHGHLNRFEAKLDQNFSQKIKPLHSFRASFMRIAALIAVIAVGSWMVYTFAFAKAESSQLVEKPSQDVMQPQIRLADISPDFKKIENYYLASVNVALTKLDFDDKHKELVDAYMEQLANLDTEYQRLNLEVSENGIAPEAVNAMIDNLKLRLELLSKLKNKLTELQVPSAAKTL